MLHDLRDTIWVAATTVVRKGAGIMDLQVRSEAQGDWKVVVVMGELDAETTPVLSDHLEQQVPEAVGQVVVDLAELSFMDSTGLALLVSWHRRLAAGGGQFRLAALRPSVHKLFRLTDLTAVMHIHDSVQHATTGQAWGSDPR